MLSGRFLDEIDIQTTVNKGLAKVSVEVQKFPRTEPSANVKKSTQENLFKIRKDLPHLFTTAIEPKFVAHDI